MVLIHDYDANGNHRLRAQIFQKPDVTGEWAAYTGPAFIEVDGRTFCANTDYDTRFPLVYEVTPVIELIIITNNGQETWRGTCDLASNRATKRS